MPNYILMVAIVAALFAALFFGIRARLLPHENRRIPWLATLVCIAIFAGLVVYRQWAVRQPNAAGVPDDCSYGDCPPSHATGI
jgi:hypothetical protein